MTTDITINISDPIWGSGGVTRQLGGKINAYTHTISAMGGFDTAQFSVADNQQGIEEWLQNGVGQHVEVFGESIDIAWEGFVNSITANLGTVSVTLGPLVDVSNRVRVNYQTVTYNTNPPIGGDNATTSDADGAGSQGLYGVLERTLSGGVLTSANADIVRDTYLGEYKLPQTSATLNTSGTGQNLSVTIECKGYYHLLSKYYYTSGSTGTQNASAKLTAILGADPSSRFSSDYSQVSTNALQVGQQETGERDAWTIISEIVANGDASNNRHLFGVYTSQIASYGAIPDSREYLYSLRDPARRIKDLAGNEVRYWNIRPGKWLYLSDFIFGYLGPSDLRRDPRYIFIESVTYTAPWSISVNGGLTGKLSQILAQQGLGGI